MKKKGFEERKKELVELAHKALSDTTPAFAEPENACDIAGKKFASDLKQMSDQQRVIAEKLINDVMYYGKLGKLHENYAVHSYPNVIPTTTIYPYTNVAATNITQSYPNVTPTNTFSNALFPLQPTANLKNRSECTSYYENFEG